MAMIVRAISIHWQADKSKAHYGVVLNELHFKELLFAVTTPPAPRSESQKSSASLIEMGFPSRFAEKTKTLCAW